MNQAATQFSIRLLAIVVCIISVNYNYCQPEYCLSRIKYRHVNIELIRHIKPKDVRIAFITCILRWLDNRFMVKRLSVNSFVK